MPSTQQLERLKALLATLPVELPVTFDPDLSDDSDWTVEPITASCNDMTVVGYVVTNAPSVRH